VDSCTGWKVGDTIAISPTELDFGNYEIRNISAINGNEITLS